MIIHVELYHKNEITVIKHIDERNLYKSIEFEITSVLLNSKNHFENGYLILAENFKPNWNDWQIKISPICKCENNAIQIK